MIAELEAVTLQTADLTKILKRVAKEHPEWSQERLNDAEKGYREYMADVNHDKSLSPDKDVDEVWHAHILHTIDYADFCQLYFNRFIHHVPFENDRCEKSCTCDINKTESNKKARCEGSGQAGCSKCSNCSGHKTETKQKAKCHSKCNGCKGGSCHGKGEAKIKAGCGKPGDTNCGGGGKARCSSDNLNN